MGPHAAGQPDDGTLVGGQLHGRQGVVATVDAVALFVLEDPDVFGDQRDAHGPQVLLVALEHPIEGLVGLDRPIGLDHLPDALLGRRHARVEQGHREVEQSLRLGRGRVGCCHVAPFVVLRLTCRT